MSAERHTPAGRQTNLEGRLRLGRLLLIDGSIAAAACVASIATGDPVYVIGAAVMDSALPVAIFQPWRQDEPGGRVANFFLRAAQSAEHL